MNVLSWLLFGLITGIVAHMLDSKKNDLMSAMVIGVGGALAGGVIANLIFGLSLSGFNITSFLLSVVGALGLLIVSRTVKKI